MRRGDVVVCHFPLASGFVGPPRPALVVQNDHDNARSTDTVLALISGNVTRAGEPTHLLIDPSTAAGSASGLHGRSVVVCTNLYTTRQDRVLKVVGVLSPALMASVDGGLRAALGLPP